ncbi:hypothetical protein Ancab_005819 [Ancistrocladus abbreviatus]
MDCGIQSQTSHSHSPEAIGHPQQHKPQPIGYTFLQLKVYTPDEVVHELEKAKVEYLEASVGVTAKKKILVPKLLRWHMQDFADDLESLIEWIYSQLSSSGLLKRRVMECLKGEAKLPIQKMVEIVPYEYEFRYLLPEIVRAKA